MSGSHSHSHSPTTARRPPRISLALTIALTAAIMALFAIVMAQRPATDRRTYGWHRVEILAALTNGVVLVVIALVILSSAWGRLLHPEPWGTIVSSR